jgi:hypothetical protein
MAAAMSAAAASLIHRCTAPRPADSQGTASSAYAASAAAGGYSYSSASPAGSSAANAGLTVAPEDAPSVRLMVANQVGLSFDLPRLETLVGIARNVLTVGPASQNAAAKARLDTAVLRLITACIKITARGFTADGSFADEEKWQSVIDMCECESCVSAALTGAVKKLLQKCLQVLHNLIVANEKRKLMLWVELFDNVNDAYATPPDEVDEGNPDPISFMRDPSSFTLPILARHPADSSYQWKTQDGVSNPFLLYFGSVGTDVKKDLAKQGKPYKASDVAAECKTRWDSSSPADRQEWVDFYDRVVTKFKGGRLHKDAKFELTNEVLTNLESRVDQDSDSPPDETLPKVPGLSSFGQRHKAGSAKAEPLDYKMTYTPDFGVAILQQGKTDLLKKLSPDNDKAAAEPAQKAPAPKQEPLEEAHTLHAPPAAGAHYELPPAYPRSDLGYNTPADAEGSEEDDFVVPGDNLRGLLTDVCLILGPNEVEVLPMIVQAGIVPPGLGLVKAGAGNSESEASAIRNMHTVRCHLLLAHENGRNLLRELLIFVAAWDLREDELFFKLMMSIVQSILLNGLLPFSYSAFREPRETVSPAQAVIMKLATAVFRMRQADDKDRKEKGKKNPVTYPQKVDVQMVNFLLTEFRRIIVPQTCALIFLQGQIRTGMVCADEFPMTLWDMERIYEGIYQYLEFFAILTEHSSWKKMLTDWQITSELITLLEELNAHIPKGKPPSASQQPQAPGSKPVSVERPYDPEPQPPARPTAAQALAVQPSTPSSSLRAGPHGAAGPHPSDAHYGLGGGGAAEDEPSAFEWRNLKKLAVLVISSMSWQNRAVQTQLGAADPVYVEKERVEVQRAEARFAEAARKKLAAGAAGKKAEAARKADAKKPAAESSKAAAETGRGRGLRALMNCMMHDEHNPYVKEHSLMALRFALEGNEENQRIFREISGRKKPLREGATVAGRGYVMDGLEIPEEMLEWNGFETYVDEGGQVLLRKKQK